MDEAELKSLIGAYRAALETLAQTPASQREARRNAWRDVERFHARLAAEFPAAPDPLK
jgi:hypothetical protein